MERASSILQNLTQITSTGSGNSTEGDFGYSEALGTVFAGAGGYIQKGNSSRSILFAIPNRSNVSITVEGNSYTMGQPATPKTKSSLGAILGVLAGILVVSAVAGIIIWQRRKLHLVKQGRADIFKIENVSIRNNSAPRSHLPLKDLISLPSSTISAPPFTANISFRDNIAAAELPNTMVFIQSPLSSA
jgi:hypothetical protein